MRANLRAWCLCVLQLVGLTVLAAGNGRLDELVGSGLDRAGENAAQLREALDAVEGDELEGMRFLIAHMPDRDLQSLTAEYLVSNVRYAYKAWSEVPWSDQVPHEIFLENVLPFSNVDERRDDWRADFYRRFMPLIAECETPAEAAILLNKTIFQELGVIYSTERPKACQSPYETIEAGMASCTGLSILLVNACRAVGVPARFVGIPLWADRSGNHSWVEIWDGEWHYTGAAEPRGDELNAGWFTGKARTSDPNHPLHSIYAVSFERTDSFFPLVWARDVRYVSAVNVTNRYLGGDSEGSSASEDVAIEYEASMHAVNQLASYLERADDPWSGLSEQPFADVALNREHAARAKQMLWDDFADRMRQTRKSEMDDRRLVFGDYEMPFFYSLHGEIPSDGRSLYISLHGGGGAPAAVNDQQWNNQKRLYSIDEGVYIAPRAPTNTWNMWFQGHIDQMFDRLIQNMILFENVDPNRVYIMGYSAGGDGLYRIGPRMADRWAAAAMMAGHPGDASPLSLYNTPFTIHMGGNDSAYNRNEEARKWGERLRKLREENPDGYEHWTEIYEGRGHWIDNGGASAIPWMQRFTRDPLPQKLVWRQDQHQRFYWLATSSIDNGAVVKAQRVGQKIEIESDTGRTILIRLNDDMLDMDSEVEVATGSNSVLRTVPVRRIDVIARTIQERGDPASIFSAELELEL